ncbi:MAG: hypothetical protein BWK80_25445 [Desulfobacteraceae bacterium IS3]|nr:MAG: hypothetical protein BWK80_25445 [Desulfobacteraceae bacterium IS3]HAO22372.1 YgiT-type zinc finger domain-containing protein [Desulfobacteraceae bacterium]
MNCEFCDIKTISRKVKRHHWLHKKLYVIENVPAEVCTECGERYFHAKILDAIDKMLLKEHVVKEHIQVEVINIEEAMLASC